MTWTRRDFLTASTLAVAGAMGRSRAIRAWQTTPPAPPTPVFTPIRRNVGFFTARGGTIGYLINPAGVLVVDSQYPDSGKLCVAGLSERSGGRPIDVLINTHHHADHTGGNIAFKATTRKIVAQANVPDLQRQAAAAQNSQQVEQVYADTTFGYTWQTTIGDETIAAEFYAPAHTGGDAVIHFQQANVVHVGDLVWNRLQTFVDRPGGASAVNWIKMLEKILATYPADAAFIIGHAGAQFPVSCTRADVLMMRDYMTALVDYVRTAIKGGAPREAVVRSTEILRGFEAYGPLTARALTGTYDELAAK